MLNSSKSKQVMSSLEGMSNALYELLKNNAYDDISITDICKKSNITRITFYRNCDKKDDLFEYLCNKLNEKYLNYLAHDESDIRNKILKFFQYYKINSDFLTTAKNNNLLNIFNQSLINLGIIKIKDILLLSNDIDKKRIAELDYLNSFMIGGLCYVLNEWVNRDFDTSEEDLADMCVNRFYI